MDYFQNFTEPSPGYHGLVYHEALGPAAFIAKARIEGLRDFGASLSPFNGFQIIQGLEDIVASFKTTLRKRFSHCRMVR